GMVTAVADAGGKLEIVPLNGKADLDRFIDVPWQVYRDDPMWRAPLRMERKMQLSPKHNPAFEHLDWQGWLALRDGIPIGRISAQIDRLRREYHDDDVGYFGMLEGPDDP